MPMALVRASPVGYASDDQVIPPPDMEGQPARCAGADCVAVVDDVDCVDWHPMLVNADSAKAASATGVRRRLMCSLLR